jgi:hypothetical protein
MVIYQNEVFEFLKILVMNHNNNRLNNQWGHVYAFNNHWTLEVAKL